MMLLCTIDVPELSELHDMPTTIATIRAVRDLLYVWVNADEHLAAYIERVDSLMAAKGYTFESP